MPPLKVSRDANLIGYTNNNKILKLIDLIRFTNSF